MENEFEKEYCREAATEPPLEKEDLPVQDAEPEQEPAPDAEPAEEIVFDSSFVLSRVRARAVKAQKHHLLRAWPKALLACVILMLPSLLLMILGIVRFGDAPAAGRAIEVMASLVPLILGGPLMMGLTRGAMEISRGERFQTGSLFFAFRDNWFFKALGAGVLIVLAAGLCTLVCILPAAVVHALSEGLREGFAYIATQVLVYLLGAAGALFAAVLYLRLVFVMPLMIDHPQMKVLDAVRLSFRATKGCTWKLLCLLLSYLGWAVLSLGIAALVIAGMAAGGYYLMILPAFYTGDIYSAYWFLLMGAAALYFIGYLLLMIAVSTFILRPFMGVAACYDEMTGREPAPEVEESAPEAEEPAPETEEPAPENQESAPENQEAEACEDTQDTPEEPLEEQKIYE